MTTATMPRVNRDRKAEILADGVIAQARRFGDQVPTEKLSHALRIAGWRAGADAVNRANDPACGLPYGWQWTNKIEGIKDMQARLGREMTLAEVGAWQDGHTGALVQGGALYSNARGY